MGKNALTLYAALRRPDGKGYFRIQHLETAPHLPQSGDNAFGVIGAAVYHAQTASSMWQ